MKIDIKDDKEDKITEVDMQKYKDVIALIKSKSYILVTDTKTAMNASRGGMERLMHTHSLLLMRDQLDKVIKEITKEGASVKKRITKSKLNK